MRSMNQSNRVATAMTSARLVAGLMRLSKLSDRFVFWRVYVVTPSSRTQRDCSPLIAAAIRLSATTRRAMMSAASHPKLKA